MQRGHSPAQHSRSGSGQALYYPKAGLPKDSATWGTKQGSDKGFTVQPHQVAQLVLFT